MKFVKQQKLKNFPKHRICSRNNQGHADKSGESRAAASLYAPHQILVLRNVKNTGIWNKWKLVLTNKQVLKNWIKINSKSIFCFKFLI